MDGPLANARGQDRKREREKLKRRQRESDLLAVVATPQGSRFIWDLIVNYCGHYRRHGVGPENILVAGRKNVALDIIEEIRRLAPEDCRALMAQGWGDEVEEDLHRKNTEATTEKDE